METESKFDLTKSVDDFCKTNKQHHTVDAIISPDYAWYMVTKHNYNNQRTPSIRHAGALAEAIKRDAFRNYTSIEFAVLNGIPHLINGQHTLHAISGAGKLVPLCIHFHRVANLDEIANLYSLYDNGRLRSMRDVSGKIGEELGLNVKERDVFAVAVGAINNLFASSGGNDSTAKMFEKKNFDFRKQLMHKYILEAKTVFAAMQGAPAYNIKLFMRGPIIGVAILTVQVDRDKAIEFWRGAAMDDGLKTGDPRKALITWLRNQSKLQRQNQHLAAQACWNAWFDGRPLTRVFATTGSAAKMNGLDDNAVPASSGQKTE